jgi:hypothetical protein
VMSHVVSPSPVPIGDAIIPPLSVDKIVIVGLGAWSSIMLKTVRSGLGAAQAIG